MITFSAVLNIVLFSSLSIWLLSMVFKDNKAILRLDIRFLLICMILILFRLLIPIESPFTNNIPVSFIYPYIYAFLKEPFLIIFGVEVSVLRLLLIVWFIGAADTFTKILQSYLNLLKLVGSYRRLKKCYAFEIVEKIKKEQNWKRKVPFRFAEGDCINTPFVIGMIRPCIIIPKIPFDEEQLYFILKHEMIHYYRGDLVMKLLCEVLRVMYWWNPLISKLEELICNMQEINVDFKIMKDLPYEKKLDYSECLVNVAKEQKMYVLVSGWIVGFHNENPTAISKRITLMLDNLDITIKKTAKSVMLSALILSLVVLCPNIIIFEPYSIAEEDEEGTFDINKDNVFYIRNKDGTFSLYLDGKYAGTVSELLGEDAEIYDSMEEMEKIKNN